VEGVKRGDLVTIAVGGDYGKPRPALVIQADPFAALPSVTVLRLTSASTPEHLVRLTVHPTAENGLRVTSQIMIDKAVSVPREKIGTVIGHIDGATMRNVSRSLVAFLGLEDAA
jgi:mRNA interferase MazF